MSTVFLAANQAEKVATRWDLISDGSVERPPWGDGAWICEGGRAWFHPTLLRKAPVRPLSSRANWSMMKQR